MKNIFVFSILVLVVCACNTPRKTAKQSAGKIEISDSTEYEITIIDPDFDLWYMMNFSPAKDRTNEFYRSKNLIAVNNWNDYFLRGRYQHAIDYNINYSPATDYGIEVNRKLYWYFKYIEDKSNIRLLQ